MLLKHSKYFMEYGGREKKKEKKAEKQEGREGRKQEGKKKSFFGKKFCD